MRPLRIAIPAGENSYHHKAAIRYYGEGHLYIHCQSMRQAVNALVNNLADYAMIASENSVAGKFSETSVLLSEYEVAVAGKLSIPVSLCLAGISGSELSEITRVISNKYALLQSRETLNRMKIRRLEECTDTAEAARTVKRDNANYQACLCDESTAKHYGLDILETQMQGIEQNSTTFLSLSRQAIVEEPRTEHKPIYISL
jgi:prephenate dehydratase